MDAVTIDLPGCKSASQRALLLACLAHGQSTLVGLNDGTDCREMAAALTLLGVLGISRHFRADASLSLQGLGGAPQLLGQELLIGEGGSTLRFLLPLVARCNGQVRLKVAPALMARPHEALIQLLRQNGAQISILEDGFFVQGTAQPLASPTSVPVGISSQFFSGLLMTSGATAQHWHLQQEAVSAGYLEMTVALLQQFRGANHLSRQGNEWLQQSGYGTGQELTIPADASAALFFAVAAILLQRPLRLARAISEFHPDAYALQYLEELGFMSRAGLLIQPGAAGPQRQARQCTTDLRSRRQTTPFDLSRSPDSGPALAVLAASCDGGLYFHNGERLRYKESDRLDGMARLARLCGGDMQQENGLLHVQAAPQLLRAQHQDVGVGVKSFDPAADHRLAMAAGVAALRWPGIQVDNPACVAKSFATFWQQLDLLR